MTRVGTPIAMALSLLLAACGGESTADRLDPAPAVGSPPGSCAPLREPLRLADGTDVYVEPEGVLALEGSVVVVGAPSYTWRTRPGSRAVMASRDVHLALRVDETGVTPIEKPVDVPVGDVRATPLDDRRWAVLLSELGADSLPLERRTVAVWHAQHDGDRWSRLERLPTPGLGHMDFAASSTLVASDNRLAWLVVHRTPAGRTAVRLLQRGATGWSAEDVESGPVETTALAADARGGLWAVLVGPDPRSVGAAKSLRLLRRGGTWTPMGTVWVAPSGAQIYDPRLQGTAGGWTVSWRAITASGDVGMASAGSARADERVPFVVDRSALQLAPVDVPDQAPTWVVHHLDPLTGLESLRLVRRSAGRSELVRSTPHPFRGFFGAVSIAPDQLVVVGPDFDPDPTRPTVRSLLLRLSTTCT